MGVERAVTRWYIQRQTILNEIASLEAKLAQTQGQQEGAINRAPTDQAQQIEVEQQLAEARTKLLAQGPCPKPMMG